MAAPRIGLDNPAFAGRIRNRRSTYERRAALPVRSRVISDVRLPPDSSPRVRVSRPPASPRLTQNSVRKSPTFTQETQKSKSQTLTTRRKKRTISKKFSRSSILTAAAVLVIVTGVGIGLYGMRANHAVVVQAQQLSKHDNAGTAENGPPSEKKPDSTGTYRVAADLPRTLSIPKIGVKQARVLRMGVDASNKLKAPGSIFDTGWYDGSSKPGEGGAVLIDGHVSGPTQQGVFYGIKTLVAGDQIKLERGDGKIFTYKVVTSKTYDAQKVDMAAALVPVTAGNPGLNLITCAGKLDASKNHFSERTIVFATQM